MVAAVRLLTVALMAGAAPLYHGPARDLIPPPVDAHEAKAKVVVSYPYRPTNAAKGFKSGWEVIYRRPTAKGSVQTQVNALVFATTAEAKSFWQGNCPGCSRPSTITGVTERWKIIRRSGAYPIYVHLSTCHNLVVFGSSLGPESLRALALESGYVVTECYARATTFGMGLCTER
jgi:hypothetical protein